MIKSLRSLTVLIALVVLVTACDLSRNESENHVAQGVEALNAGQDTAAVRAFEQATSVDPTNANAWYYLGYTRSRMLKNAGGAIDALEQAVELDSKSADAPYELGYARENREDYEGAIEAYREAAHRDPSMAGAHFRMGNLLERSGDFREAIDAYSHAIHANPSLIAAWIQLGNLYGTFGATDESVAVFKNGIENNLTDGDLRGALGVTLFEAGRMTEAINALNEAVEAGHSTAAIHMTLGMAYLERSEERASDEDRTKAVAEFERALTRCSPARDGNRCNVIGTQLQKLSQ